MTREEAVALLERYSNYDGMGIPNLAGCKEAMKVAVESLKEAFLELRESEEERIRKALVWHLKADVDFVSNGVTKAECIAYLEKQKDASKAIEAVERIDKYIDEHLANAHDMKDSNPDKKYYRGWDDALGKMSGILQDVYSDANQKEQKPASTEDMPYITDEHFYEREPVDSFKYKLAEYMTKNRTKGEGPYGYSYNINSESILQMAEEELLKRGVVQKPAEWSEEDERMRNQLIYDVEYHKKEGLISAKQNKATEALYNGIEKCYDEKIAWLKSLRPHPHWKPSEDEERLINASISFLKDFADKGYENAVECIDWLKSKSNGNTDK